MVAEMVRPSAASLPGEDPPVESHDLLVEGEVLRAAAVQVVVLLLRTFN